LKKFLKVSAVIISGIILLIVACWIGLAIFIAYNKDFLRNKLVTLIEKQTKGKVTIREVSSSLLKTFPFMSLQISGISIRDSLYQVHRHSLFEAEQVYLRASPASLITKTWIGKIIVRSGSLYLFTDSSGYSNNYLIKSKSNKKGNSDASLPDIQLESFNIEVQNPLTRKHYKGFARRLDIHVDNEAGGNKNIHIKVDLRVAGIGFNTRKGYFIQNTRVQSKMHVDYDGSSRQLSFNRLMLNIDDEQLAFNGAFDMSGTTHDFHLDISAPKSDYTKLAKFFPQKTRTVLGRYNITGPIDIRVTIEGKTAGPQEPHVTATMIARKNDLSVPGLDLANCTFTGTYNNRMDSTRECSDANSIITFTDVRGKFAGILVKADKTTFKNLDVTYLETDLHADFALAALDKEFQSSTLKFNDGHAVVNASFEGPIMGTDRATSKITGYVRFKKASVSYVPRSMTVTNLNGDLLFKQKDLVVPGLSMSTGKSIIKVDGRADNFLSLFNISPEQMQLAWNVRSDELFLEDFKSFLTKRGAAKKSSQSENALAKASNKIDKMFTDGSVHLTLTTPAMHYRKFNATDFKGAIMLTNDYVDVENVSLKHADGTISLKGRMTQAGALNKVSLSTDLQHINVPGIFTAFSNFGQDAITAENLRGRLTANVNLETYITDAAKTRPELTTGSVKFLLQDGELHEFEPVKKISEKAFKKQDFSNIRFADLQNLLEIKGTAFIVNRMEIRSTAITMFVEGIYDTKKGTDMSIQLPVRNLLKSNAGTDLTDAGRDKKGISVRLRAHTGEDGKLQVGWDPFKKAVKNKEAVTEQP